MRRIVLYIGNFSFPNGNAAGKRVYANGKLFRELGYEVMFIGMSKELNQLEPLEATKQEYDGFKYYNFKYPSKSIEWLNYRKTFKMLDMFLTHKNIVDDIVLVVYYGSPRLSLFNAKLIKYCNSRNIKVVSDCVDWLTTKTNNFVFDLVKWADNTYQKAYVNKKADGIIAISNYLSKYYKKNRCNTVIIPPLSSIEYRISESRLINTTGMKTITYAGIPFRKGQLVKDCSKLKDRIDKTIILLHCAKKNDCKFIFNIYGFTKEEYLQAIPEQKLYVDELGEYIIFHGLKPNNEVVDSIADSDFTILIRDVNKDTTAGFPTKVSESISCGTPVITTRTSDLEDYIIEGKNGFFIDINEERKSISELLEILSMDNKKISLMKNYCANSKLFYYKNYINRISKFLNEVNS